MTFKEIQDLIKLINKSNLTEFKLKEGDFEISIRTKKYHKTKATQILSPPQQIVSLPPSSGQPTPPPFSSDAPVPHPTESNSDQASEAKEAQPAKEATAKLLEIKSPIVGTFYRAPSPEKLPFVKVGDTVEVGQVVCIVEAMKLFNEIESEVTGKIVKVLVEEAQPVEYDQVLFLVDPS